MYPYCISADPATHNIVISADPATHNIVAPAVADHEALHHIELELADRLPKRAWPWLAAVAAFVLAVVTDLDVVERQLATPSCDPRRAG